MRAECYPCVRTCVTFVSGLYTQPALRDARYSGMKYALDINDRKPPMTRWHARGWS